MPGRCSLRRVPWPVKAVLWIMLLVCVGLVWGFALRMRYAEPRSARDGDWLAASAVAAAILGVVLYLAA